MEVPTLDAGIVTLRPWRPDEASWYVSARDDAVLRWTREPDTMTTEQCAAQISRTQGSDRHGSFAIVDCDSGQLVGNVGITVHHQSVELSYWVAAEARGRGIAAAALAAAAEWAAAALDRPLLELDTHPDNLASQSVARRAGFVAAGRRPARDDCGDVDGMVAHFERRALPAEAEGSMPDPGQGIS
ncbi:MAG: GNAT family N-acetyltransferase [Acidimicrobiia bacterium]